MRIELGLVKKCHEQPIASLSTETFPRVVQLKIMAGGMNEQQYLELTVNHLEDDLRPRLPDDPVAYNVVSERRSELEREDGFPPVCGPNAQYWKGLLDGRTFPHLEKLSIDHSPSINVSICEMQNPGVDIIPENLVGLQELRFLELGGVPEMNDAVLLAALPMMGNLRVLKLTRLKGVTYRCWLPCPGGLVLYS